MKLVSIAEPQLILYKDHVSINWLHDLYPKPQRVYDAVKDTYAWRYQSVFYLGDIRFCRICTLCKLCLRHLGLASGIKQYLTRIERIGILLCLYTLWRTLLAELTVKDKVII